MASASKSTEVVSSSLTKVPSSQLTGLEVGKEKAHVPESSEHEHLSPSKGATDTAGGPTPPLKMVGWSKSSIKEEDLDQL